MLDIAGLSLSNVFLALDLELKKPTWPGPISSP